MSKKLEKFKVGRPGFSYKNGKLYHFEKRNVLVMSPWPDPRAWYKSARIPWHSSRKRADKVFQTALFPKGEEDRIPASRREAYFELDLRVWTGDPNHPCIDEIHQYQRCNPDFNGNAYEIEFHRARVIRERESFEQGRVGFLAMRKLQAPYFDAIPDGVRSELLRYGDRKWHLLNLFARCPGALDLSHSNPGLCYALASNWVFHKPAVSLPLRAARRLVGQKQKAILDWLGFPGTDAARKLLQKIKPSALDVFKLLRVRNLFADCELVKWLSHIENVNKEVLEVATKPILRRFLTGRLLREISEKPEAIARGETPARLLEDSIAIFQRYPEAPFPEQFLSLRRLREFHDEMDAMDRRMWNAIAKEDSCPENFPPPPFAGTETIVPLLTRSDLYREGAEMRHCVGSYSQRVALGGYAVYGVLSPVRATMGICSGRARGGWRLDSLMMAGNRPVDGVLAVRLFEELVASGPYRKKEESLGGLFVEPELAPTGSDGEEWLEPGDLCAVGEE